MWSSTSKIFEVGLQKTLKRNRKMFQVMVLRKKQRTSYCFTWAGIKLNYIKIIFFVILKNFLCNFLWNYFSWKFSFQVLVKVCYFYKILIQWKLSFVFMWSNLNGAHNIGRSNDIPPINVKHNHLKNSFFSPITSIKVERTWPEN